MAYSCNDVQRIATAADTNQNGQYNA